MAEPINIVSIYSNNVRMIFECFRLEPFDLLPLTCYEKM